MRQEFYECGAEIVNGELKPIALIAFRQAMKRFTDGHVTIRVEIAKPKQSATAIAYVDVPKGIRSTVTEVTGPS